MEELYLLLSERGSQTEEISTRLSELSQLLRSKFPELKTLSVAKSQEWQEFSKFINQMKRNEKIRIIKENDLIDIVFNLKNFDLAQHQRFQEVSYGIMKQIRQDFVYSKPKLATDTKDLASLYLNFFVFCDMQLRVEDLKRVYVDNRIRGLPIVSVLAKWLVELTREQFKNILNEVTKEYETYNPAAPKPEKPPAKMISPKAGRFFRSFREQKLFEQQPEQEKAPPLQETKNSPEVQNIVNSIKRNLKRQSITHDNSVKIEKSKSKDVTKDSNKIIDTLTVSSIQIQKQSAIMFAHPIMQANFNTTPTPRAMSQTVSSPSPVVVNATPKHFDLSPQKNKKNPLIRVYVNIPGPSGFRNLELIEDLDFSCSTTLYPIVGISRGGLKKLKGKNLVTVDTDKKRDAINQIYKSLYAKNSDAEKTISSFQNKAWQKKKTTAPFPFKKSELTTDDYPVEYFEKLYHNLNQDTDTNKEPTTKSKHHKHKKGKGQKLTPYMASNEIKRPSTVGLIRRARSNGSIHPMTNVSTSVQNDSGEEHLAQSITKSKVEAPIYKENRDSVSKLDTTSSETYSDNYFRILKMANFPHKIHVKGQRELKDYGFEEKAATEYSFTLPQTIELSEGAFVNLTNPSEEKSPKTGKRLAHLGPYLKKLTHISDDFLIERASSSTNKIKAGNLIMQTEHFKKLSGEQSKQLLTSGHKHLHQLMKEVQDDERKGSTFSDLLRVNNFSKIKAVSSDPDFSPKLLRLDTEKSIDLDRRETVVSNLENLKTCLSFESEVKEGMEKRKAIDKHEHSENKRPNPRRKLVKPAVGYSNNNHIYTGCD